jgi:membrane associated rhomboid family serine protease
MIFSALHVIILVTVFVSMKAFSDSDFSNKYMNIPYRYKHNKEYYRVVSHIFIHADPLHLMFNMFSFYFLGRVLEHLFIVQYGVLMGEIYFVSLYFLGGIFATLIPFIRHHDNSLYRSLGASGAVSAVVFATILWMPELKLGILFIPFGIKAYIFGPIYLLIEYLSDKRGNTGVAHDAHIGGALFGVLYVLILNFEKGKEFIGIFFN